MIDTGEFEASRRFSEIFWVVLQETRRSDKQ